MTEDGSSAESVSGMTEDGNRVGTSSLCINHMERDKLLVESLPQRSFILDEPRRDATCREILQQLNRLREEPLSCDCVLHMGNQTIQAHKAVLSATSKYFAAGFKSDETKSSDILIQRASFEDMRQVVDLLYGGTIAMDTSSVERFKHLAEDLDIKILRDLCEGFIADLIAEAKSVVSEVPDLPVIPPGDPETPVPGESPAILLAWPMPALPTLPVPALSTLPMPALPTPPVPALSTPPVPALSTLPVPALSTLPVPAVPSKLSVGRSVSVHPVTRHGPSADGDGVLVPVGFHVNTSNMAQQSKDRRLYIVKGPPLKPAAFGAPVSVSHDAPSTVKQGIIVNKDLPQTRHSVVTAAATPHHPPRNICKLKGRDESLPTVKDSSRPCPVVAKARSSALNISESIRQRGRRKVKGSSPPCPVVAKARSSALNISDSVRQRRRSKARHLFIVCDGAEPSVAAQERKIPKGTAYLGRSHHGPLSVVRTPDSPSYITPEDTKKIQGVLGKGFPTGERITRSVTSLRRTMSASRGLRSSESSSGSHVSASRYLPNSDVAIEEPVLSRHAAAKPQNEALNDRDITSGSYSTLPIDVAEKTIVPSEAAPTAEPVVVDQVPHECSLVQRRDIAKVPNQDDASVHSSKTSDLVVNLPDMPEVPGLPPSPAADSGHNAVNSAVLTPEGLHSNAANTAETGTVVSGTSGLGRRVIPTVSDPPRQRVAKPSGSAKNSAGRVPKGLHGSTSNTALVASCEVHKGVRPFLCEVCSRAFKTSTHLKGHMQVHSEVKPFLCEVCPKAFKNARSLRAHVLVHHGGGSFACEVCPKLFANAWNLKNHQLVHSSDRPFTCSVCSKSFKTARCLKYHGSTSCTALVAGCVVHKEVRPFLCEVCSKAFKTSTHLKGHMQAHSEVKPFSCEVCQKAFKSARSLRDHLLVHSGGGSFSCEVCPKLFVNACNLKNHQSVHSSNRPFTCSVCSKSFKTASHLKYHRKRHSVARPFSCEVCTKSFKGKSDLWGHMNVHTKKKRFCCEYCSKECLTRNSFMQHLRTHTGEEPYSCDICLKTFKQKCRWLKHVNKVHYKGSVPDTTSTC